MVRKRNFKIFADVNYYLCWRRVGESEKVQKCANVIWSLRNLVKSQKSSIISYSLQQQIGEFEGRFIRVESSVGTIEETFVQIQSTFDQILIFNDIQLRFFSKNLKSCEDLIGYGITESGRYYLAKGQKISETISALLSKMGQLKNKGTLIY